MERFEQKISREATELSTASEAFYKAFSSKCREVFGTDAGISYRLNGKPPRARIHKEEPTGGLASPETWQKVQGIATEIASSYDLNDAGLEMLFELDGDEGPTIIIQEKEV